MQDLIRETIHSLGPDTAEKICAPGTLTSLRAHGLMYIGLSDAGPGYRMHRPAPDFGHLLVTRGGAGCVLVDGRWLECGEGSAYISPPGAPSAFEMLPERRWQFAWVFTLIHKDGGGLAGPEFGFGSSTLVPADPGPLATAIEGIYQEGAGQGDPLLLDDWARLVRAYTARFVQNPIPPSHRIDPLAQLWAEVDARPAAAWSIAQLSRLAHVSGETLRKLCLLHNSRSPMEQVTHLRMRRADTLLRSTSMKLIVIAQMVGYENAFAFSTAFRRWCGVPPSARRLPRHASPSRD